MKEELALQLLSRIMNWDNDRSQKEFSWLRVMSRYKYDDYQDYLAGVRFTESLLYWLQQFEQRDRETAYSFVRHRLVYIGAAELQHLVALMYPETIRKQLVEVVATQLKVPAYNIWKDKNGSEAFKKVLRKTLFFGLSDGARIDAFRRANSGIISNEQVFPSAHIDDGKWNSALTELRDDLEDSSALFESVYLIDDFVGSGATLLRKKCRDGDNKVEWKGKIIRFWEHIQSQKEKAFTKNWKLYIHHYLATYLASDTIKRLEEEARVDYGSRWFPGTLFSFGYIFPKDFPITETNCNDFIDIMDKYYDSSIETKHSDVGQNGFRRGFAGCSLPLVLDHNTPNNSVALIWAESVVKSSANHVMRPLFRRRQRHF